MGLSGWLWGALGTVKFPEKFSRAKKFPEIARSVQLQLQPYYSGNSRMLAPGSLWLMSCSNHHHVLYVVMGKLDSTTCHVLYIDITDSCATLVGRRSPHLAISNDERLL